MRTRSLLMLLVCAAGALRFSTLGVQSFWSDEGFTVSIVGHAFTGVLGAVRHTESTPPLYYWIAWCWRELFGSGEWGLRSLSALLGTLTVPVTYAAARELFSRRVGLIAAALVTFSPVLIWYSQEARAYSLLLLLGVLSVWLFARALHGDRRAPWGWAVTAALALATHYFAVFTVLPEAVWLIARRPRQWRNWAAAAPAVAVALALLPLFLYQDRHVPRPWTVGYTITDSITGVAQAALVGPTWTPIIHRAGVAVMAILALAGLILLARDRPARVGALLTLLLAGVLVAAPLAYAVLATNYLDIRNVIVAVPLALMAVAAGFSAAAPPLANALMAAVCAVGLAIALAVPLTPALQREDWRGAIARLSAPALPRVWVFLDRFDSTPVSAVYLPHAANLGATATPVREVDILGRVGYPGTSTGTPIPDFRLIERRVLAGKLAIERFRASHAIPVTDAQFGQFNARVVTTAAGYVG
jgi:uncharacterized membrane protein